MTRVQCAYNISAPFLFPFASSTGFHHADPSTDANYDRKPLRRRRLRGIRRARSAADGVYGAVGASQQQQLPDDLAGRVQTGRGHTHGCGITRWRSRCGTELTQIGSCAGSREERSRPGRTGTSPHHRSPELHFCRNETGTNVGRFHCMLAPPSECRRTIALHARATLRMSPDDCTACSRHLLIGDTPPNDVYNDIVDRLLRLRGDMYDQVHGTISGLDGGEVDWFRLLDQEPLTLEPHGLDLQSYIEL